MKVLVYPAHLRLYPEYGSEPNYAWQIMKGLKELGVEVIAITGDASIKVISSNMLRIISMGVRVREPILERIIFIARSIGVVKKHLGHIDIIHHMFPFGYGIGFNPTVLMRIEKPLLIGPIQMPQSWSDISDYIWIRGKRGLGSNLLALVNTRLIQTLSTQLRSLHLRTLLRAAALVFDSKKALDTYVNTYSDYIRGKIIQVIPTPVETDYFSYQPPKAKDHVELLTVSYHLWRKGIHTLLISFKEVLERERINAILRIVGEGPITPMLKYFAKRLGISNRVVFEGKVPREKLLQYYANCDIYVHPSLSETFPSAIKEAMSVGRPIIATRVGAIDEFIVDGVHGYLVKPGDYHELTEKIATLSSDPELRIKMGLSSRKTAEQRFSPQLIATSYLKIYEHIV